MRHPQTTALPLLALVFGAHAIAAPSPEIETLSISKRLNPISDEQWQSIAGERASEAYQIEKGDTLWDISKRLFGDGYYWPKVWAINNGMITNPHVVRPGKSVYFTPGSGSSLPQVALDRRAPVSGTYAERGDGTQSDAPNEPRPTEWKQLPRQNWEQVTLSLPPTVDPQGFDRRNRVSFSKSSGFEINAQVFSDELDVVSEIKNAGSPANGLSLTDEVYLERNDNSPLEIGKEYTVTQEPVVLSADGHSGYVYENRGTIRVIGKTEDVVVAQIVSSRAEIRRGDLIVGLFDRISEPTPIPGVEPLEGELFVDRTYSTLTTAEHKLTFVNRGTDDGVQVGMVFRSYDDVDPSNGEYISDSNLVGVADFIVVQTSKEFSATIVKTSNKPVDQGTRVVLLTDVSELRQAFGESTQIAPPETSAQDSGELSEDEDGSLTPEEERELRQLEEYEEPTNEFGDGEFDENEFEEGALPPDESYGEELPTDEFSTEEFPEQETPPVDNLEEFPDSVDSMDSMESTESIDIPEVPESEMSVPETSEAPETLEENGDEFFGGP